MAEFPLLPQPLRGLLGLRSSVLDRCLQQEVARLTHASHAPLGSLEAAENMASDGFHPNARGYAEWANVVAEHLASVTPRPSDSLETERVNAGEPRTNQNL
jgi:hypothetical protein